MFYKELERMARKAQVIAETLDEELNHIAKNYLGDMYLSKAEKVNDEAKQALDNVSEQAQALVDKQALAMQEALEKEFFNDVTSDQAQELALLGNIVLTKNEMEAYLRKFEGNGFAMRQLEKIAKNSGLMLLGGRWYGREKDNNERITNLARELVVSMKSGNEMRLNVGLRLLEDKINTMKQEGEKEIIVMVK